MSKEKVDKNQDSLKDTRGTEGKPDSAKAIQIEDAALKTMMKFFAEELLPFLDIKEKAADVMTTETVKLEIQKAYEDFNLMMENGECYHFEFQSTNKGLKNIRRSRFYEAGISCEHDVPVTTFVLFSGRIRNPMTEITEGINTYCIQPIIMKEWNADELIQDLRTRMEAGETLSLEDLVPLALTPLMDGEMPLPERIREAFSVLTATQERGAADRDLVDKLTAVLYAMSEKFLSGRELDYAREGVQMTRLGQMLVDEGWEQGLAQGREQGRAQGLEQGREQGRAQGLEQGREQGLEQGREQGILQTRSQVMQTMVQDDLRIGTAKERILQKLQTYFDLPPADAERYYIQYSQEI